MEIFRNILVGLIELWTFIMIIATNKDSYKATVPAILLQIATLVYIILN